MKARNFQKMLAVAAAAGLALSASTALAQDSSAPDPVQPAAVNAPVPQLAYGVAQIVKLVQAKVSDDTIIAYIKSSGDSYGLNADQIIYLRQQGVSDAVITAMLNQPKPGVATATIPMPTTPAPQPVASAACAQPAEPYVGTEATTYYDYEPYYYPVYSYNYWPWPVVVSSGWGGYYGGYRGGWRGGAWRGGSAWHGGGGGHGGGGVHGGAPNGGWHGGGSGGGWHGGGHR